jgi:hypothetical protein
MGSHHAVGTEELIPEAVFASEEELLGVPRLAAAITKFGPTGPYKPVAT